MNSYNFMVTKTANGIPLYIVEVSHTLCCGFSAFNTENDAKNFIEREKAALPGLKYDPGLEIAKNILEIMENGETGFFSKLENKQIYKL